MTNVFRRIFTYLLSLGRKRSSATGWEQTGKHLRNRQVTSSPGEATSLAFEWAEKMPPTPLSELYRPFNEVAGPWGAKRLYRGPKTVIRDLFRENLERLSATAGFGQFSIGLRNDYVLQVSAFYENYFIGTQIWRTAAEYLSSGNKDFAPGDLLARDERLKVESTEEYEAELARRVEDLKQRAVRLPHSLCGQVFSARDCRITKVTDTALIFFCPQCRVPAVLLLEELDQ